MDNERSTQGTSAPLLPLLQRFQNIHSSKEEPIPEEEIEVEIHFVWKIILSFFLSIFKNTPALTIAMCSHWNQEEFYCFVNFQNLAFFNSVVVIVKWIDKCHIKALSFNFTT